MKQATKYLLCLMVGILLGCLPSFFMRYRGPQQVVTERVDTLLIRDTITQIRPVFTEIRTIDTIKVAYYADTLHIRDTIYTLIPIEQRVYEDSTYRAVISGYRPSLDSIQVYRQQVTIDHFREVTKKVKPRWGIGVQVGAGATLQGQQVRLSPYVGVGIQYNLITF